MTGKRAMLVAVVALSGSLAAQDVVVLKSGESLSCRIEAITDNLVNIALPGVAGGTATRTLAAAQVDYFEMGFREGEEDLYRRRGEAGAALLQEWWEAARPHLHRPRSRAGAWGVAYAEALLREDPESAPARVLSLCDLIVGRAWSQEDVAAAKQTRMRALMAAGDLDAALDEAKHHAEAAGDPSLLVEVEFLIAQADFAALRELETEHPRWRDDDEVRPGREALFHRALDRFLSPHLFHASLGEPAARGLFAAAELFRCDGDLAEARARWIDLTMLYPETSYAAQAAKLLESEILSPDNP